LRAEDFGDGWPRKTQKSTKRVFVNSRVCRGHFLVNTAVQLGCGYAALGIHVYLRGLKQHVIRFRKLFPVTHLRNMNGIAFNGEPKATALC